MSQPVIIPSEIQTREFDAKLLLACMLAEEGVPVYVGARHEIHANIHRLPQSLYLAKDFRKPSLRIFRIMKQHGHQIVAWDEEVLQIQDAELYYQRRVTPEAIAMVEEFYAWGGPNKALIENAPGYPGAPVHVTGNPRIDMLRAELRSFHDEDVSRLKARFGDFILINSNFGAVNPAIKSQVLKPGQRDRRTGNAPNPVLDDSLRHRAEMLDVFLDLLPRLIRRFPDRTIVVRPHPAEDHTVWKEAAGGAANAQIIHEGSILAWLLAARVMIHNSCTTGLESFLLGRRPILYQPKSVTPGQPVLSNTVSRGVDTEPALFDIIESCFGQDMPDDGNGEGWRAVDEVLSATTGPLASERVARHVLDFLNSGRPEKAPSFALSTLGGAKSRIRKIEKSINSLRKGHKGSRSNNLHRYPGLTPREVDQKMDSLRRTLGRFGAVGSQHVQGQIYRIVAQ